ncbi:uncharacterized protein LOC117172172 [Belonocnema kinseyi]|uniref:uncharacterized protein LOC117172172 n=1 Tax=Belonocnema kinseyi TaxID=2817044 RepID=UPI00143DE332|nr:uncharacterized protein LOC117172172 [Belonocnema kinseyi]
MPEEFSSAFDSSGRDRKPSSDRSSSPAELSLRARTRSPPARFDSMVRSSPIAESSRRDSLTSPPRPTTRNEAVRISGITFEEISLVQLVPKTNPNQRFKIQKYTFPSNTPLLVRKKNNVFGPLPIQEETVLLKPNGDILAIFMKNNTILRGIYKSRDECGSWVERRVKINIHSHEIQDLNTNEKEEAPLGASNLVSHKFEVVDLRKNPHHSS